MPGRPVASSGRWYEPNPPMRSTRHFPWPGVRPVHRVSRSPRFGGLRLLGVLPAALALVSGTATGLDRTWIGGNVDWLDGGTSANWNPADEPDSDDRAIFNTANTVSLGSNNSVNGLVLSGGIDLLTADFNLTVDGLTEVSGAGTNLVIGGAASLFDTDNLTINSGGVVELGGGGLTLDEESGAGLLDINAGGSLVGNGTVTFADVPGITTTQWVNDGTLSALSRALVILGSPPVGTLSINDSSTTARIDLDGAGEAGVVNVYRNQTLDLNIPLADNFNGSLNLFHNATFDSAPAWTMAGGTLNVENGFVDGVFPIPDIPAGTAVIDGGNLSLSGGTITVADTDGTLRFDTGFSLSGGTLANAGKVVFNGTTVITSAAGFAPSASASSIEVSSAMTVNDVAGNFNWDGPGAASTTILGTGSLTITANQVDTTDNIFGGTLNLNDNADLTVTVVADEWTVANSLNKNNAGTSVVSGDRVVLTGTVNVNTGTLDLPAIRTSPSASINTTGTLTLGASSEFAGATGIGGAGLLRMEGASTVSSSTTIGVATFDWDGLAAGSMHTIAAGVTFTINSPVLDGDGDMDDPVTLAGSGSQLVVNGPASWTSAAAIHANLAGAGSATIGGTSRLILSGTSADLGVTGNTTINCPLTFGTDSAATISPGFTLSATNDVVYTGATITGTGNYSPGLSNLVTGNTTISSASFDFDNGSWTVEPGVVLSVNVTDYDNTATNIFDSTITLNSGAVSVTTGDAGFVMDSTLNMHNSGGGNPAWSGEPVEIGSDSGVLDADLVVSGDGNVDFASSVDFNSDADVSIAAGANLRFLSGSTVVFSTVNGGNNAEFTGSGAMTFNGVVNVVEAATLNLAGGSVDLDGTDGTGEFINIDAPFTINVASFANFGRINGGGGVNTLDVNNSVGTGVLAVNLDDPAGEWTLNGPGVMNLVNDNTEATLLAGSAANLNGTVNVTGDVRTTARVDLAGPVNINTAGQPFRLGGGTPSNFNTIAGATIAGVGILGADTGRQLRGFGTIHCEIDFDGSAMLLAEGGTLTLNGPVTDVGTIGTVGGVLDLTNPWNTMVAGTVLLAEGQLAGANVTVANGTAIQGRGLVSARVANDGVLSANDGGTLVFQTAANDNDWDGAGNAGQLTAQSGILELRDAATFGFTGAVSAGPGAKVFTNGFALDFNPGSSLLLANGTYQSTSSTDFGGTVTTSGAAPSTIEVQNNFFLEFESTCNATLNRNLVLVNNNIVIRAGATFSGVGALVVPDGSHLVMAAGANANVLLNLDGALRPANSEGIGRVDVLDYQQGTTGELIMEISGTALNQYDRLVVNGIAVVDGYLLLDLDGGFVPTIGQTFNVISASGGVTGMFSSIGSSGMPAGLAFKINYLPTVVQVEVIAGGEFDEWIHLFPSLVNPADRLRTADPDGDGRNNLAEFAFDGDPTSARSDGKVVGKIAQVGGVNALTLTFPVRNGPNSFYDPPGGEKLLIGMANPPLHYVVQASDDLVAFPLTVDLVGGPDALAIQAGLPPLNVGWTYATCRSPGPVEGDPAEFMRVGVAEGPLP